MPTSHRWKHWNLHARRTGVCVRRTVLFLSFLTHTPYPLYVRTRVVRHCLERKWRLTSNPLLSSVIKCRRSDLCALSPVQRTCILFPCFCPLNFVTQGLCDLFVWFIMNTASYKCLHLRLFWRILQNLLRPSWCSSTAGQVQCDEQNRCGHGLGLFPRPFGRSNLPCSASAVCSRVCFDVSESRPYYPTHSRSLRCNSVNHYYLALARIVRARSYETCHNIVPLASGVNYWATLLSTTIFTTRTFCLSGNSAHKTDTQLEKRCWPHS